MSSQHSVSDSVGDSGKSRKSSRFGPRNLILSSRFSMFNTAALGFTLTLCMAALQGQQSTKKY